MALGNGNYNNNNQRQNLSHTNGFIQQTQVRRS